LILTSTPAPTEAALTKSICPFNVYENREENISTAEIFQVVVAAMQITSGL
jgi:hypothetical protein